MYPEEGHPKTAPFIERIFELRAEGILSDQEICDQINAMGYKGPVQKLWSKDKTTIIGRKGGHILNVKSLQSIIKKFSYCKVVCEKWTNYTPIHSKSDGLVSIDTWNKANRGKLFIEEHTDGSLSLLKNIDPRSGKRKKYNSRYPYKGIIMCDVCKKPMKASSSRGKSGDYFGSYHCERTHKRNAFSQKQLEEGVVQYLDNIKFSDPFLDIFEKTLRLQFRAKEGELSEQTAKANTNVAELETQKSNLIRAFSNATIPEVMRGIEDQIKEIQSKIDHAKTERTKMELVEDDLTDFISWCHKIMEHPSKLLTDIGSEQELIATASIFFDELPTYSQILSGTPKLSLFFKLSEEFETDKSRLVTPRGIEPRF